MIQHQDFQLILPLIVSQKSFLLAKVVHNLSHFTHALHRQYQSDVNHEESFNGQQENSTDENSNTVQPISMKNMSWQNHISTIIQIILSLHNNSDDDGLFIEFFYILSKITKHDFPNTSWSDLLLKYSSLYDVMVQKLRSCALKCHYNLIFSIVETLLQICINDQNCIKNLSEKHSDILLVLYHVLKYSKKFELVESEMTLQVLSLFKFFLRQPVASDILSSNSGQLPIFLLSNVSTNINFQLFKMTFVVTQITNVKKTSV